MGLFICSPSCSNHRRFPPPACSNSRSKRTIELIRSRKSGDQAIRSIKPGDPRKRLSDGHGLYLLLFVKGGAHGWRLDYSINARRKTLSLGTYPDTGLSLARKKADEARRLLSADTDASDVRKSTKAEHQRQVEDKLADAGLAPSGSFEAVAREWLAIVHTAKGSGGHAERTQLRLEQDVFPWLGRKPIAAIKAPELLECLRRVEGRGAIEAARRVRQACAQVFRYGIACGQCERDLAADLRDAVTPVNVKHRAAITNPKRAGELLRAIGASPELVGKHALIETIYVHFERAAGGASPIAGAPLPPANCQRRYDSPCGWQASVGQELPLARDRF